MKKSIQSLLLVVFLLQLIQLPVMALDVIVQDNGSAYFYQGQVLGDDDSEDDSDDDFEEDSDDDFEEESEVELKQNRNEKVREQGKKNLELEKKRIELEKKNPIKVVTRAQKTKIKVKSEGDMVQIRLEGKAIKSEMLEDKRFRLELPAAEKEDTDEEEEEATDSAAVKRSREERQERKAEKFEIQSEVADDGTIEFQFESRDVKAKLNGAQFTVDPATNIVTLITPSGNIHHLNHLPDQAIRNMIRAGVIRGVTAPIAKVATESATTDEGSPSAELATVLESELELEVQDDGSVVYTTTVKKPKKLLGLFRRDVLTKVQLDDETGEISESEVRAATLVGRLLNYLSL